MRLTTEKEVNEEKIENKYPFYFEFSDSTVFKSKTFAPNARLDFDSADNLVGLEIFSQSPIPAELLSSESELINSEDGSTDSSITSVEQFKQKIDSFDKLIEQISIDNWEKILPFVLRTENTDRFLFLILIFLFDDLNDKLRERVLEKLTKSKDIDIVLAFIQVIEVIFYQISDQFKGKLLLGLSDSNVSQIIRAIVNLLDIHFDHFQEGFINEFFFKRIKLFHEFFPKLEPITEHISGKMKYQIILSYIIIEYSGIYQVYLTILKYKDRISQDIISYMLKDIEPNSKNIPMPLVMALVKNYSILPKIFIDNLLELANKKDGNASVLAVSIIIHFDQLPDNIRDLFYQIAEKNMTLIAPVTFLMIPNFDKLSDKAQSIFMTLIKKEDGAVGAAVRLFMEFDNLSNKFRTDLLSG